MTEAKFWDRIAPKYAQDPIKDQAAYEYTLGRTQSYLGSEDRVLEIGCGTGSTALLIAPGVGAIEGTDISPAMLEVAAERQAEAGVRNAIFSAISAEEAARLPGPFDAVLGFNILHLLANPKAVLRDIHQQLPKGGFLITKTPCIGDPSVGFKRFIFRAMIPVMTLFGKAPSTVQYMTHAEVDKMITDAGFDIVESGNFPAISRYVVARKR
ncbi:class I SAM-dependent methyltransferase [Sulfitobacter aestuariivivens]|uniref:Class I SAM-dependent methyltransferase n=1 Tax=Sulfitobacter aestuariivivens TaxID=2766981 RepID=A0A927HFS4_9RHOB|nr:methyltransferase [Sulfitobacter aestuariivivens]MBD3664748.1 class I SAM-dependent methyltransferase [Sulfitobacter aestuariivivens]